MTHPLFKLLNRLDRAKCHYSISRHRLDTLLITVTFIGERVEVDVFEDGHMEVSRFPGSENIHGGEELIFELIDENEAKDI